MHFFPANTAAFTYLGYFLIGSITFSEKVSLNDSCFNAHRIGSCNSISKFASNYSESLAYKELCHSIIRQWIPLVLAHVYDNEIVLLSQFSEVRNVSSTTRISVSNSAYAALVNRSQQITQLIIT